MSARSSSDPELEAAVQRLRNRTIERDKAIQSNNPKGELAVDQPIVSALGDIGTHAKTAENREYALSQKRQYQSARNRATKDAILKRMWQYLGEVMKIKAAIGLLTAGVGMGAGLAIANVGTPVPMSDGSTGYGVANKLYADTDHNGIVDSAWNVGGSGQLYDPHETGLGEMLSDAVKGLVGFFS